MYLYHVPHTPHTTYISWFVFDFSSVYISLFLFSALLFLCIRRQHTARTDKISGMPRLPSARTPYPGTPSCRLLRAAHHMCRQTRLLPPVDLPFHCSWFAAQLLSGSLPLSPLGLWPPKSAESRRRNGKKLFVFCWAWKQPVDDYRARLLWLPIKLYFGICSVSINPRMPLLGCSSPNLVTNVTYLTCFILISRSIS